VDEALLILLGDPVKAHQLTVWSKEVNHANLHDWRLHTPQSCPVIFYGRWLRMDHNTKDWAMTVYRLFQAKHAEESKGLWGWVRRLLGRSCTCVKEGAK